MKRFLALFFAFSFLFVTPDPTAALAQTSAPEFNLTARAACLMEASTGTVLYEKNADTPLSPASITKIMTLILIFDALHAGQITLTDPVTTSAYAKSMGGSQVFLEEGEVQTVETLIKCIVIASGNDASVAMAEHLAGTESEFVRQMNERAAGLHMTSTHFVDCCGLTTDPKHLTSARDVSIMSRELITRYPEIEKYSTIWMETITHVTRQGSKEFVLANTNKLLKTNTAFQVTGLKTGSTSLAKYCYSGTARKDGVELIAVIMAADNYKLRFSEAQSLLNYGFATCRLYRDTPPADLPTIPVDGGIRTELNISAVSGFSRLFTLGEDFTSIKRTIQLPDRVKAPVTEGDVIGQVIYTLGDQELGCIPILAAESIPKATYWDCFRRLLSLFGL